MTLDHLPAAPGAQARVVPIYETMEGWSDSTRGARSWAELPAQCIKYVRRLEELIGAPVALLSTSPNARTPSSCAIPSSIRMASFGSNGSCHGRAFPAILLAPGWKFVDARDCARA